MKLLEDLYSAIEAVLERTESVFGSLPTTKEWPKDLLRGMASPVPGFRPQVLERQTSLVLDEFLRFRHFGRHGSYRERIPLERVLALAAQVESAMTALSADLAGFWEYAEAAAQDLK